MAGRCRRLWDGPYLSSRSTAYFPHASQLQGNAEGDGEERAISPSILRTMLASENRVRRYAT